MIRHFFLDKTNTIVENTFQNLGLNPILHIGYGNGIMRGIIDFDMDKIRELIKDKTFANIEKLHVYLKMVNCFSVDGVPYEKTMFGSDWQLMQRASSFDLIGFKLPKPFDEGRGYEFTSDIWVRNRQDMSTEGSNWYASRTAIPWDIEADPIDLSDPNMTWKDVLRKLKDLQGGVYSIEKLEEEYTKYKDGKESLVIAEQHFDFGNENLNLDITDYVLDSIDKPFYGIGISFSPLYEKIKTDVEQYVGFFNDNTNTYFHPYVEVIYDDYIDDDRESFTINRKNKLFLYVSDDGNMTNLDNIPSCQINGVDSNVKQITKGVYCATINPEDNQLEAVSIYTDVWSDIKLNGITQDDVELEFSTRPTAHKTRIGESSYLKNPLIPTLFGINNQEELKIGETREVTVDFRRQYSTDKKELVDNAEYRLYVLDGDRQYEVFRYQPIEKAFLNNFFIVYTEDLIPNIYHIDIRIKQGREVKYFNDILQFKVSSDITERYY